MMSESFSRVGEGIFFVGGEWPPGGAGEVVVVVVVDAGASRASRSRAESVASRASRGASGWSRASASRGVAGAAASGSSGSRGEVARDEVRARDVEVDLAALARPERGRALLERAGRRLGVRRVDGDEARPRLGARARAQAVAGRDRRERGDRHGIQREHARALRVPRGPERGVVVRARARGRARGGGARHGETARGARGGARPGALRVSAEGEGTSARGEGRGRGKRRVLTVTKTADRSAEATTRRA